ncbi:hypothetical protein [Ramlibacter sp.]|uniref:hypothetical protein n=1 Tax=Ramlibacter sp. TaxID=1917967 RepID=UPI002FCC1DFA
MTLARTDVAQAEPAFEARSTSLEASDDFDSPAAPARYCPVELLDSFTLLMAGHGRCVSSAMMLGDREYAVWQLARAQALSDEALGRVAARLFAWLEEAGPTAGASARRL